ncbi:MAG: selenide, water dikinase SelD [Pseudomonadota bacterium]|nr:selenide, water dikinase SelD [Burkholderiales bacterium]MDQ3197139.1 selenide, water dikinase SelD [Pseudomonadota bacterium]
MDTSTKTPIRLTEFSHGGGCGCKIAPALLSDILSASPLAALCPDLLVGNDSSDDAAVYRINDEQAIVATTDFFMPIVDDPFDFGRIAATNALSDVYAMGAKPLFALAIVGMPVDKLPIAAIQQILAGGASVCNDAGIPIAGGHSIDSPEPIYGLVAVGLVHPDKVKRNDGAEAGDVLILGKPLGIGILSAALKKGELGEPGYRDMLASTTQLNTPGAPLADLPDVHALTDVTGFGLLGHLLEMCRGAGLDADIEFDRLPILADALRLAEAGYATGASTRNWASYAKSVRLAEGVSEWQKKLLTDPQTSGGLLVACAPDAEAKVLAVFHEHGFALACNIGTLRAGKGEVAVR